MYARYHFGWSELTALTDGRFRYIKAPHEELYDLERDPHERDNIAEGRPPARQALRGALDRLIAGTTLQAPSVVPADARERLQALGYVGAQTDVTTAPGDTLPDPKDKREILERYRAAVDAAGERKWREAIGLLQQILKDDPEMADVWSQLATFAGRLDRQDIALDAYKHFIELRPSDPGGYLGAAASLFRMQKLKDAREHAQLAVEIATDADTRSRENAHELLAKIALARHDADEARAEAKLAQEADPRLPIVAFIDARLLYDQNQFAEALPHFEAALAEQKKQQDAPVAELHYFAGDTYGRLERYPEAERQFLAELHDYPQNIRARAGLAMLYQATGRADAAQQTIEQMMHFTPTPESYSLAARLWTMFGNRQQADAVRAEARHAFTDAPRAGTRAARD
jgi:tetratricopeptide (TPR) repeat protein